MSLVLEGKLVGTDDLAMGDRTCGWWEQAIGVDGLRVVPSVR